jgi:PRTRC genetic system ThiF family protein
MKHFLPAGLLLDLHPISVHLIGVGGTGSQMLTALARIHHALLQFERKGLVVTVFDKDKVSLSNIGRQLFSTSDIGKYKAQVLIDRCNRFFGTEWEFKTNRYPQEQFGGANIIISCVDNAKTRHDIHNMFSKKNKSLREEDEPHYFLDFGNMKVHGQVILGTFKDIPQPKAVDNTVGKLKTIIDMYPSLTDDGDDTPSCSLAAALSEQDLFINTSLIPFGATMLWNLLKNYFITFQGVYVNLAEMSVNPVKIE